jgi:hypothetical protein
MKFRRGRGANPGHTSLLQTMNSKFTTCSHLAITSLSTSFIVAVGIVAGPMFFRIIL